ncbi:MAG: glycerophosphodiester phosphodiesterase [Deltaproteobacteria bacterium]|nr:glycerophosphodiester phosphodiesterase [Deltaproteobacteria bacterium]
MGNDTSIAGFALGFALSVVAGCGATPPQPQAGTAAASGDRASAVAAPRRGGRAFDLQGHRGARGHAPENTLVGLRRALAIGVTTLEIDLALTADGVVVVHHDETLNADLTRGPDGEYIDGTAAVPLRQLSVEALSQLDVGRIRAGTAYAMRFPDQVPADGARIPTLAAVFAFVEEVSGGTTRYNLELKRSPIHPDRTADPETFARAALAVVDAAAVRNRVNFQSFDFACLDALRALGGDSSDDLTLACLTVAEDDPTPWFAGRSLGDHDGSWPALVAAAGCDTWSPRFEDLTADTIREAHGLGLRVIPWTVNDPAQIAEAHDLGVDGLISDYPDRVRADLAARGEELPIAFPAD